MNDKVYIHEYIDIILQGRPAYMNHMTQGWGRGFGKHRPMKCFGVWGTLGSTARWPECINMWELDGWDGMAANFAIEISNPTMQEPALKEWWDEAQKYRSGGFDRLIVPTKNSLTVDEMCKDKAIIGAEVFYHERVQVVPRKAKSYLSMVEQEWVPVAKELGLNYVGGYRTAMRNDSEVFLIWAIRTWKQWGQYEMAVENDPRVEKWRDRTDGTAIDWISHLMCSAPLSPTRTGQQPG